MPVSLAEAFLFADANSVSSCAGDFAFTETVESNSRAPRLRLPGDSHVSNRMLKVRARTQRIRPGKNLCYRLLQEVDGVDE